MSSFFSDEKDIRLCVLESLPDIAATRELNGWISGKEVTDTKGLVDEISRLIQKNKDLSNEVTRLKEKINKVSVSKSTNDFDEVIIILKNINIVFPSDVAVILDKESMTLLEMLYLLKERLVTGVPDALVSDILKRFIFHIVCPRLQIHGLSFMENRRFFLTKKGQELLAHIEMNSLK